VKHHLPHAAGPRAAEPSARGGRIHREPRGGFTLVELLTAAAIVALIAAVAVPVVMQALAKARTTAIKAEIDMLHMAIMNYKNEYGSFPPAFNRMPPRDFGLPDLGWPYHNYPDTPPSSFTKNGLHDRHITRIFPRASSPPFMKQAFLSTIPLNPFTALAYWLSGYSNAPAAPTQGETKPLYDFDRGRLELAPAGGVFTGRYHSPNAATSGFYVYIDSANYVFTLPTGQEFPTPLVEFDRRTATLARGEDRNNNNSIDVQAPFSEDANGNGVLDRGQPFNPETFQILHPGRDGVFGTEDDLSNFWPGTRKEFLDSL
jgi:prepilin-type N-terminal cleavage/methylation domain-containing protein